MGQAQINVRTRACSRTFIARTKQAALTHNVKGEKVKNVFFYKTNVGKKFICLVVVSHHMGTSVEEGFQLYADK